MVDGGKESFKGKLVLALGVALFGLVLGYSLPFSLGELGCFLPFRIGVVINVTNDGSMPVSNLRISFNRGENTWAKLDPGRAQMFKIKPSDSGVVLSFVDALGNLHSQKVDVYLEKNYHGTIDIKIDRSGKITWKDEIIACPN
jgi:hypothetical protein